MTSDIVGLYAHIPFCSVKCFYCDFTAFSGQGRTVGRYLRALEAEAALMPRRTPDTVYIGGGTPSELSAEQIAELFSALRRAYPGLDPAESTFEANPESLTKEKLLALRAAGVNRLSLGLQTGSDALLKEIGRKHTRADFFEIYKEARNLGCFSISIDLMYNLPGQSVRCCLESLEYVLSLEPEHVSLYGLSVEDQTLFSKRRVEPDEDLGREMFERSLDRLSAAGFHHYEISNFARPGFEAQHNTLYWKNGEYVGLGCGAASHMDGVRSSNIDRLPPYLVSVEAGKRPVEESEMLLGKEALGEEAMLGLRIVDGFVPTLEMEAAFGWEISLLEKRGLLWREGRRLRLSREGLFVANTVFREFVPPFSQPLTTAEVTS